MYPCKAFSTDYTLIYDKPVIYTDPNFDRSPYDAWWLDKPLWKIEALPRLGTRMTEDNMENLKELIEECLSDPRFAESRKAVRAETWLYPGEGAVRAADYLIEAYNNVTREAKN